MSQILDVQLGGDATMAKSMASQVHVNPTCGVDMPNASLTPEPPLPGLSSPEIAQICLERGICRLSLFGSRLQGRHRPDSDMDLLVEFEPGRVPGLIGLSAIEIDLGKALGHKIDLRTVDDLSHRFRDAVIRSARPIYAR